MPPFPQDRWRNDADNSRLISRLVLFWAVLCHNVVMNKVGGPLLRMADLPRSEQNLVRQGYREKKFHRLISGIYLPVSVWRELGEDERRKVMIVAYAASAPGSVVVGKSAARLHGLKVNTWGRNQTVELGGGRSAGTAQRRRGVTFRTLAWTRDEIVSLPTEYGTVQLTSLEATGVDLARWHSLEDAVIAVEAAYRIGLIDRDALDVAVRKVRRRTGAGQAYQLEKMVTKRSDSPRESLLKVDLWRRGLPAPYQQTTIFDSTGAWLGICDFYFEVGLVVEYDGQGKYNGEFGADPVRAMRERMLRQDLFLEAGMVPVHVDKHNYQEQLRRIVILHAHLLRQGIAPGSRFWSPGERAWRD